MIQLRPLQHPRVLHRQYNNLHRRLQLRRRQQVTQSECNSGTLAAPSFADDERPLLHSLVPRSQLHHLESQLTSTRTELSELYKTQSQNAQRLLDLNERLKTRDDDDRARTSDVQSLREERDRLARREADLRDAAGEKDRVIEMLQDELSTLSLELNQVESRNDDLKRDNAALLQRWLERARQEADNVNDANRFVQENIERRKNLGLPVKDLEGAGSGGGGGGGGSRGHNQENEEAGKRSSSESNETSRARGS